jgi:CRP-like cAMP-binding protein
MKFRKSRHFRNKEDIEELTATYNDFGWSIKELEQSNLEKVEQLLEEGVRQKDIAEMTGLSKGCVSKLCHKLKKEGTEGGNQTGNSGRRDIDDDPFF